MGCVSGIRGDIRWQVARTGTSRSSCSQRTRPCDPLSDITLPEMHPVMCVLYDMHPCPPRFLANLAIEMQKIIQISVSINDNSKGGWLPMTKIFLLDLHIPLNHNNADGGPVCSRKAANAHCQ